MSDILVTSPENNVRFSLFYFLYLLLGAYSAGKAYQCPFDHLGSDRDKAGIPDQQHRHS